MNIQNIKQTHNVCPIFLNGKHSSLFKVSFNRADKDEYFVVLTHIDHLKKDEENYCYYRVYHSDSNGECGELLFDHPDVLVNGFSNVFFSIQDLWIMIFNHYGAIYQNKILEDWLMLLNNRLSEIGVPKSFMESYTSNVQWYNLGGYDALQGIKNFILSNYLGSTKLEGNL